MKNRAIAGFSSNGAVFCVAEKEGFEPSRPLWGLHDFQSCALDQTTRLLHELAQVLPIFDCTGNQLVYYMAWGAQSQEFFQRADGFSLKNYAAFHRFFIIFSSAITAVCKKCAARRGGYAAAGCPTSSFPPRVSRNMAFGAYGWRRRLERTGKLCYTDRGREQPRGPAFRRRFSRTGGTQTVRASARSAFG